MAVTTQARPESRATTTKKWVYLFEEGNKDMRDLLGGKGAGVAEMTRAGLPVPPGFTITTEACNAYYASGKKFPDGMWEQAIEALHHVEEKAGKKLGDKAEHHHEGEPAAGDTFNRVGAHGATSEFLGDVELSLGEHVHDRDCGESDGYPEG